VLLQLVYDHPGQNLAVVTHGGTIRWMLRAVYNLQGVPEPDLAHIGNTSICEVQWNAGHWQVVRVNDVAHVSDMQAPDMLAPQDEQSSMG
jgi:probable phosphoglycerate mutase